MCMLLLYCLFFSRSISLLIKVARSILLFVLMKLVNFVVYYIFNIGHTGRKCWKYSRWVLPVSKKSPLRFDWTYIVKHRLSILALFSSVIHNFALIIWLHFSWTRACYFFSFCCIIYCWLKIKCSSLLGINFY